MTAGQNSSTGSSPAWPPQVFANTLLISNMAMSQRMPSHWSAMLDSVCDGRVAQLRGERVELDDIGPRREVRVAPVREESGHRWPARRSGSATRSSGTAPHEQFRSGRDPWVIGRDVIRHVVEDQPHAPVRERRPRRRQPGGGHRTTRRRRSVARSTANRARRSRSRSGSAARKESISCALDRAMRRPAGLRSHTPISQTASTPGGVTAAQSSAGTSASVTRRSYRCESSRQPRRGVDLVDDRMRRPTPIIHAPCVRRDLCVEHHSPDRPLV